MTTHATFTAVFRGDIRAIDRNPFEIDTPFGRATAIAQGDALAELDEVRTFKGQTDRPRLAAACLAAYREAQRDNPGSFSDEVFVARILAVIWAERLAIDPNPELSHHASAGEGA